MSNDGKSADNLHTLADILFLFCLRLRHDAAKMYIL